MPARKRKALPRIISAEDQISFVISEHQAGREVDTFEVVRAASVLGRLYEAQDGFDEEKSQIPVPALLYRLIVSKLVAQRRSASKERKKRSDVVAKEHARIRVKAAAYPQHSDKRIAELLFDSADPPFTMRKGKRVPLSVRAIREIIAGK